MRNHPVRSPTSVACEQLAILAGWCVTLSLCGGEARDLEQCCGGVPELVRCRVDQCLRQDRALDVCMSKHTREEKEAHSESSG